MALQQLLEQLCKELEMECPKLDRDKSAALAVAPSLSCILRDLAPGIALHGQIAPLPSLKKREDFFLYLMRANFLGQGTGGARIGLDADEKFLTLSLGLPYEMNYQTFKEAIEDFVNYIAYWREEAAKFEEQ